LAAQVHGGPSLRAERLDAGAEAIRLDGRLDEAVWRQAPPGSGFRQREPAVGVPASEATEVHIAYNHHALYVGVLARDQQPDGVIARILQRDRLLAAEPFRAGITWAGDDVVAIVLDPFHDHRNAYVFATNPNGAEFEALLTDEGREFNRDWRGVWRVAAHRGPDGWTAEFEIPFRTLRYPSGGGRIWGFNVGRMIRRKNEEALWSGWSRDEGGLHRVSRAGHLEGLEGLPRAGFALEAKPYFVAGGTRTVEPDAPTETDTRLELGADLKWEVAPGLLLDVTANTDFAQVEVDDEQVNLTRFDLFFPEKRDFFLENAGVFEYGWRSFFEPPPFLLFFSRTIGVVEDGEVPILGGVRLTGRAGRQTIGVLDVVTDSAFGEPRTNHVVVRVKRDVGGASYVGAMLTDRRNGAAWNLVGGVDFSAWPAPTLNLQGFLAGTATQDGAGDGLAARAALEWNRDRIGLGIHNLYVGPEATADMGFVTRTDILRSDLQFRVTPRPGRLGLRKVDLFLFGQRITDTGGRLQDWMIGPAGGPEWESGESLTFFYVRGETSIDKSFDLEDRVTVPAGTYHLWQTGWFASTSPARPIAFRSEALLQGTFHGRLRSVSGEATLVPVANLTLAFRYAHNSANLPAGSFDADLAAVRLTVATSPRLVGNALVQYNSLDRTISANVRVAYTFRPGSDLFLVLTEERGDGVSAWASGDRAAVAKITWLFRF
jgi:hypothetical protein